MNHAEFTDTRAGGVGNMVMTCCHVYLQQQFFCFKCASHVPSPGGSQLKWYNERNLWVLFVFPTFRLLRSRRVSLCSGSGVFVSSFIFLSFFFFLATNANDCSLFCPSRTPLLCHRFRHVVHRHPHRHMQGTIWQQQAARMHRGDFVFALERSFCPVKCTTLVNLKGLAQLSAGSYHTVSKWAS